jgi:hypothetical protein
MTPLGLRWRADELRAVRMGFTEAWLVGRRIVERWKGTPERESKPPLHQADQARVAAHPYPERLI